MNLIDRGPSSTSNIGLVGTGGFAREVMPYLVESGHSPVWLESSPTRSTVNGLECLSLAEFIALPDERRFNIAVADSHIRQRLAEELEAAGCEPLAIVAGSAIVMDSSRVAAGSIICANAMVTANAAVGRFFHANIYSYVAHDCVIGDYVTLAPRASVNGNVHVGDHAYIGTSAVIRQGDPDRPLTIGAGAVIGMGAVVTKDVAPGVTVVGNPARPLASR